jgi:hypothetical protein
MSGGARSGAAAALALGLAFALGACTGPPWFMGTPLDGRPSVPATRKNPSWRALQVEAATARSKGQTILEIPALVALADLDRLDAVERERLVTLLERRAAEFRALGRPIPEARDLDRLVRLAPARAAALRGPHAVAARAAGDEWLAVGALNEARVAYDRAVALGARDMDFRVRALSGYPPPAGATLADLRFEIAALPLRVVPPVGLAYVSRGGRDSATLARVLVAARQEKHDGLAVSAAAALSEAEASGRGADDGADAGAPDGGAPEAGAPDAGADAQVGVPMSEPDGGAALPAPARLEAWLLEGVTVEARLLPLLDAHPELFDDAEHAVGWVDLLLAEDETSPRILELAALVFGRAARFGGTERMLMELAYATPDRAAGLARGAVVW